MAMLRAFSTRRSREGYEPLLKVEVDVDEPVTSNSQFEAQLKRARSVPARVFGLTRKFVINPDHQLALPETSQQAKKSSSSSSSTTTTITTKKVTKSHPLFSLFDARRKKKTTAKPEFSRYLQYVKEGGTWDINSNKPVLYYR